MSTQTAVVLIAAIALAGYIVAPTPSAAVQTRRHSPRRPKNLRYRDDDDEEVGIGKR